MRRHYQNFAFDLYGTLVDIHAEEDDPALWYHLSLYLNFRGIPFEQEELRRLYWRENDRLQKETDEALEKQGLSGPGEPEIRKVWAALFSMKNHETNDVEIEDICRLFRALSMRRLRLFPDTMPLLRGLREAGKRIFLLTNAQAAFTWPELRFLGLDTPFDGILISSEAGMRKPSPSFYQRLLDAYSLDPAETIMTGNDHQCDCRGADRAGLDSLYIFTGGPARPVTPLPGSCREIQRLLDVLQYV